MLVPNNQACENQFSSTTPIPASTVAARNARAAALQSAVGTAQQAANALLVANPWESWRGGMNLMRDIQRGNTQVALPGGAGVPSGPAQLPGLPPAGQVGNFLDRLRRNLGGRGQSRGWNSRFVKGPGGKFQTWPAGSSGGGAADSSNAATIDCAVDAADVVPSEGIMPPGAPELTISHPPAGPDLRTEQPVNIIVAPPAAYAPCSPAPRTGTCTAAGMGEWSASIAKPGAVPAECTTGAPAQTAGPAGFPWWLWALAGIAVVAVATTETQTRRSGAGQKRTA